MRHRDEGKGTTRNTRLIGSLNKLGKQRLVSMYATVFLFTVFRLVFEYRIQSADVASQESFKNVMERNRNSINQGLSVLSYSLYGNKSIYLSGMVETAKQDYAVYPDWEVRVYHDQDVPGDVLRTLASLKNVRLINVVQEFPEWVANQINPMSWRFLVASDPAVDVYAMRDADSRPSIREKAAVDEWIRSGISFHIMRDHPAHDPTTFAAILGGMWGGRRNAVPSMDELLWEFSRNNTADMKQKHKYADDQDFLWKHILPLARNNCLQHDSYYCVESGGIAFPMTREETGNAFDFVGNCFNRMIGTRGGNESWDAYMSEPVMIDRYTKCLELRNNLTKFLERTRGSSKVIPVTPYMGRSNKSSTEMLAEQLERKRKARLIFAEFRRKKRREVRKKKHQ